MLKNLMDEFSESIQQIKAVIFAIVGFALGVTILYLIGSYTYKKLLVPFLEYMNWGTQLVVPFLSSIGGF